MQASTVNIKRFRMLGMFGYIGLIILIIVWQTWLAPHQGGDNTTGSQGLTELSEMARAKPELQAQIELEQQKWQARKSAHQSNPTVMMLVWLLPLLLPAYGLFKGRPYTAAWSNFIVMLYYMHALTVMYTDPDERHLAILEFFLANCMLFGNGFYARLKGKELGLGLKKLKTEMAEEKAREEARRTS